MDWSFFVPILGLSAAIVALAAAYLWPPSGSVVALKRRMSALEADHETDSSLLQRIKKRHYALEGHVYGSDDDDDDEETAAPAGHNLAHGEPAPLALIPDVPDDFPEEAFQEAVARRRGGLTNG